VVESAVNAVGADLNTASPALLRYIAGIGPKLAGAIVAERDTSGPFRSRATLRRVKGLGPKAFEQAAGFLRVPGGDERLDNSPIHPESYGIVRDLFVLMDVTGDEPDLAERVAAFRRANKLGDLAAAIGCGEPTLTDIFDALIRPGRDARDDLPPPILRQDVLKIEDLREGMALKGMVRNVVDFGAFVDIGVKHDGLLHVSRMGAARRDPQHVLSVGDVINVTVVSVDAERGRIALSLAQRD
jgi:uncharacterized protein